jgi:hypothetical protein
LYALLPDDGWKYHPKHVEQFPDINKLYDDASCWIYEYTGILLGARPVLHINRIKVNITKQTTYMSIIKNIQLILLRDIIGIDCEYHMKDANTHRG